MKRRHPYTAALVAELEAHGVTKVETGTTGGDHQELRFSFRGRELRFIYPSSPSDNWRGLRNSLANLRHLLGVKRVIAKNGKPRSKRRKIESDKVPRLKRIAPKPHPFEKLSELKE
ncbi:MAG: hypothetical protein QNJ62_06615 [Methyloceanibacter sp.]|nr:hypothetical protein [Methyloceanibacter sp.]